VPFALGILTSTLYLSNKQLHDMVSCSMTQPCA